jgi:hypothetical protein
MSMLVWKLSSFVVVAVVVVFSVWEELITQLQTLSTLNLSIITIKFRTIAMFVIIDL